jgi:hypothetical protein
MLGQVVDYLSDPGSQRRPDGTQPGRLRPRPRSHPIVEVVSGSGRVGEDETTLLVLSSDTDPGECIRAVFDEGIAKTLEGVGFLGDRHHESVHCGEQFQSTFSLLSLGDVDGRTEDTLDLCVDDERVSVD